MSSCSRVFAIALVKARSLTTVVSLEINEIRLTACVCVRVCVCERSTVSLLQTFSLPSPANPLSFSFSFFSCKSAVLFEFYLNSNVTGFFLKLSNAPPLQKYSFIYSFTKNGGISSCEKCVQR